MSGKILSEKEKEKESAEKQSSKKNRLLVTVNVLGSTGPIRFVVDEGESVNKVVSIALKMYARERRLPVLGSDVSDFLLYPANNAGFDGTLIDHIYLSLNFDLSLVLWTIHLTISKLVIVFHNSICKVLFDL